MEYITARCEAHRLQASSTASDRKKMKKKTEQMCLRQKVIQAGSRGGSRRTMRDSSCRGQTHGWIDIQTMCDNKG